MKPILIGMNNPVSTLPGYELYPLPEGCTGNRIWKMLHARTGATRLQYRETFERRNLVRGVKYERSEARANALAIYYELFNTGRTVVLLGNSVRESFDKVVEGGLPPLLVHPQVIGGVTWRQIPHPSGRNLWYNEPRNTRVVEMLLEELFRSATEGVQPMRALASGDVG